MNLHKLFLASLALSLGWAGSAFAQNEVDALRYTRLGINGSARIQGIGGAQTALGADISNISSNPAGLGMFRRSEFSISPGLQFNSTDTRVDNSFLSTDQNAVSIPHAGLVISNRRNDESSDWTGANLGISFTRLNNFNQRLSYSNTAASDQFTIVEYFAEQANNKGVTLDELNSEFSNGYTTLEGLAFGAYLIDVITDDNGNETVVPLFRGGEILQREDIRRKGSQNQFDIGVGTSYKDRLYLGASVGVVTSNFTQESIYRESESDASTAFTDLELRDEYTTRGAGINLKVGAIYRPVDALRLGISLQTPTAYTFTDTYQRALYASYDDGPTESAIELPGEFTYNLVTPFRATIGAAGIIGKYGFITADVEFVNYSNIKFSESDNDFASANDYFNDINSRISNTYQSAVNYRIGAEGRFDVFRIRAGFAHTGDPYKNASFDGGVNSVSAGAGVRLKNYYADLAYIRSSGNSRYSPFVLDNGDQPVVDIDERLSTVMLTFGYNF
ncbi:OmpP1/FadL family transporter [Pontibacter sp. H249]|uniref:OmpP1/FadL family transporter n=1 Tax=Pontibacter sp. H249 TaxID=3133420 RepID=UPI0030BB7186